MKRKLLALGFTALLLTTAGCAGSAIPDDSVPVAVADTEPAAAETAKFPTQILDGSCQQLLDSITVSVDLGDTSPKPAEQNVAVGTLGGISCAFSSDQPMYIDALPRENVPDELAARYQQVVCEFEYDHEVCRIAVEAAGNWALVTLGYEPSSLLEDVAAAVAGSLEQSSQPARADRESAWWAPATCEQISEKLSLSALLGEGEIHSGNPGHGDKSVLDEALQGEGVQIGSCAWMTEQSGSLRMKAFPGGAWAAQEQMDTAAFGSDQQVVEAPASITVADGIEAISLLNDTNTELVWLSDGTNLLFVEMRGIAASPEDASSAILGALSAA